MIVSIEEAKSYLRVEYDDDDGFIEICIQTAEELCQHILRSDGETLDHIKSAKIAVLYAVAYLYEHREEADHHQLTLTLRALLFGDRKVGF